ncbi:LysR family transcriptional regulator [Ponticoccus sp. SC2-23]|uniref:LysR family transcriptional regulator n=1 Tax=Alexandriicola marinus TaxID=2081710 RepID=UPI000FD7D6E1|nr:LysR family transcriptional regulator [Alexandriicola marinus]MBM1221498.1 LysR family transcriptional regulator [Ponticoccus sp. SC6-9]MBM1226539.1 LysR family transcriptional regulator [Ponticoccus sp. SC6-15]MBM1230490.1 LysR family transcriptional regulator [Ponticoccus sp. SC6-38]MBM1235013.1 LysR family transcriptional regulator [Ponticoccus sp. SC6-45]MBM1239511.1 LysR family transcriptional regulator [Ponticoccus sp. SC6-49]MBM1243293.1 LysR family transcriptional regulator [Pontic
MIDKLEMFLALARTRHFGKAAEECGVTQPTLSAAIRQLEDQLGVMLVLRGSRFQGLTPEGKRVLEWARQIVGDARTMREEMRAAKQGLSGNLRIAAIPTALNTASRLTNTFIEKNPNVRLTLLSEPSNRILEMLEDLRIDAGLTYMDNEPLGRVVTVPLYAERYVLLVRTDSPLAGRDSVGWKELGDVPLCLLTPDMQNRRIISDHLSEAGIEVNPTVESNSTIVLVSHILFGGLATILPDRMAETFVRADALVAIPIRRPDWSHQVGLIAPYREPHTPVLAALIREAQRSAEV